MQGKFCESAEKVFSPRNTRMRGKELAKSAESG
jgi:hypothetical protein